MADFRSPEGVRPFGPGTPYTPTEATGSAPRTLQPPVSQNLRTRPRDWSGANLTSFQKLRALADVDLVRIVIQDVKGQILGMERAVALKEGIKDTPETQKQLERAKAWVDHPDPGAWLSFRRWLSKMLEEVLVTDALSLYPLHDRAHRFTDPSGRPFGLRQIDGATIVPLVDALGQPPVAPDPAFEQVIQGRVETAFRMGELWYLPRFPRPDSPYGRSNTECVLITINLALRADLADLSYYTDGTLPDGLYAIAADWSPDQIRTYQEDFDAVLEGNEAARRRIRFVPTGTFSETKKRAWDYQFREWMARVVAWAFQVSPMPIAKQMNRATGETMEQSTIESGVRPLAEFIEEPINQFIAGPLGCPDVEMHFGSDETEDGTLVKDRNVAYLGRGVRTINSVRREIGEDDLDPEIGDEPLWDTPSGPVFLKDIIEKRKAEAAAREKALAAPAPTPPASLDEGGAGPKLAPAPAGETDTDAGKAEADLLRWRTFAMRKAAEGKPLRRFESEAIPPHERLRVSTTLQRSYDRGADRLSRQSAIRGAFHSLDVAKGAFTEDLPAAARKPATEIEGILLGWLDAHRDDIIAAALEELPATTAKTAGLGKKLDVDSMLDMGDLVDDLARALAGAVKAGSSDTIDIVGFDFEFDAAPKDALEYAQNRAAELVGKKRIGGVLVDSPTVGVSITETLRDSIRGKVTAAIAEGWSPQKLTAELTDALGKTRAERVARTETALAYNEGAYEVYAAGGQEYVEILDGDGCIPDGHDDLAEKPDGTVGIIQFDRLANGQIWALADFHAHLIGHPNCVRAAIPYEATTSQEAAA